MVEPLNTHSSIKFKISIAVALVLSALGGYFAAVQFSEPGERDLMGEFIAAPSTTAVSAQQQPTTSVASVGEMLEGLRQRLERQPENIEGWILLSKSYYHLNRQAEAEESFARAVALGYSGNWQPLPRIDTFAKAATASQGFNSAIDPGKYGLARKRDMAHDQVDSPAAAGLHLKVAIDPELKPQLSPESAVYVFARSSGNSGPPLAVVRKKVGELPLAVRLDNSHAMMPNLNISNSKTLIVGARISTSGNPQRQPGDYEQLSESIPSDYTETIELVIKNRI